MDEYMLYSSVAETAGVYHEFLTPKEIKDRWPLVRTEDLIGALLWLADDKAAGFVTGTVIPVDGGFSAFSGV